MSSKAHEADDERIPTYEESLQAAPPSSAARPSSLNASLAQARHERIQAVINAHLAPLLAAQAAAGLHRTTAVLVPSNVAAINPSSSRSEKSPSEPADSEESVVGFPSSSSSSSEESVRLVRLRGADHALEFWRQPAVTAELQLALEARLAAEGHRVLAGVAAAPERESAAITAQREKRAGFWGRRKGDAASPQSPPLQSPPFKSPAALAGEVLPGQVRVRVSVQEVSVRVCTDMGLYDSRAGPAVVVGVEIG